MFKNNKFPNSKRLITFLTCAAMFSTMTGCFGDDVPVASPDPELSTSEEVTESVKTTEKIKEEPTQITESEPTVTTEPKEKKVTVEKIVDNARSYISKKGVFENYTVVEWGSSYGTYVDTNKATLESGFNKDFYYIIEKNQSDYAQTNYTLYVNEDWGYIYTMGSNYKIMTDLILLEANIKNFKAETMAETIISSIILDNDNCTLSEDESYYYIDQRLEYQDLLINKANSCSFTGINGDESIRQTLTFDKETGALIKSEVTCKVLNVSNNSENYVNVEVEYSYEQTHEFPSGITENCEEIDGFYGFSIY